MNDDAHETSPHAESLTEAETVAGELPGLPTGRQVARYVPGFLLRTLVPCLLIVAFFSIPFGEVLAIDHVVLAEVLFIVFWTCVFILFLRWQLKSIHSSATPEARWIEALLVLGFLFVSIFSRVYRILSMSAPDSFNHPMTVIDSYYYTVGTLSTAGTGALEAHGQTAEALTTFQILANLAFIGLIVRVLTGAARTARERKRAEAASGSAGNHHSG